MPQLNPNPPPFTPTGRYTEERRAALHKVHKEFLSEAELAVLDDFMCKQNRGFAWDDTERGSFRSDMFPKVKLAVVPHVPWREKNLPIPPGLYQQICEQIQRKIKAGVYEPSNSSYRSRWFCVLKKDGSLRLVHSLEPLNRVTIQHAGVPPIPDHLAEQFAGRACGSTLDLYVGYDEREIDEASRDLTTFQTPFGAMRLTTLPMGWSNSVPIFHEDVCFILQDEIPHVTIPYVDDVPIKGPATTYPDASGREQTIPQNPGVRRYVWEHLQDVNRVVQRVKHAHGTFSGKKNLFASPRFTAVGHYCTPEGRRVEPHMAEAIANWTVCNNVSDVRAFLGTVGVARIFVHHFAKRAHHLVKLTRKDVPFEWGTEQQQAMADLKDAVLKSPALRPIDYESGAPVIIAVDTSQLAVGYQLCQQDPQNPRIRYYSRFGSITLNEREARFSQPKLELYGLFRTLRALCLYLIGLRNLVVEVDALHIKGMLENPDIIPSASMNRWVIAIKMFHFELVHVPGERHGPDGLSRRPVQDGDSKPTDDADEFDDWIDRLYGFMHLVNPPPSLPHAEYDPRVSSVSVLFQQSNGTVARMPAVQPTPYASFPRSDKAKELDSRLREIEQWLLAQRRPDGLTDRQWEGFRKYASRFFVDSYGKLWRIADDGAHKRVLYAEARSKALVEMHDHLGHRGVWATRAFLCERFWWPDIKADVTWYVKSCRECQLRQTTKVYIPPTVSYPVAPMVRMHVDAMDMPAGSGSYKYFLHGRCALTAWPEARATTSQTAKAIGDWLYQELLCRWGALSEIISDNGAPWIAALEYLARQYHVHHIRISGYNSRANGVVESSHHPTRDSLVKACGGDPSLWPSRIHSVLWADRVTVRRRLGCSPYFAVTGTQPVLPMDITEASYLMPVPVFLLSTAELIARRAIALQKRPEQVAQLRSEVFRQRVEAAKKFEAEHHLQVKDFAFTRGRLVLMRNTAIEKSLDRKMKPRYLGPFVVVTRNRGGAYVLAELNGAVFDRPVAAFRLIPYLPREAIPLPLELLDADTEDLRRMEQSTDAADDQVNELGDAGKGSDADSDGDD